MRIYNEKIPTPKELEKEIGEFLKKKFGDNIKMVSPVVVPQEMAVETPESVNDKPHEINFDLKPEELVEYLDRYIVKQDPAKAVLATKICTHFNRLKKFKDTYDDVHNMVGHIKNNILMMGPTGVGKTYMIKLIAN